jgi:uridine phosphorylase
MMQRIPILDFDDDRPAMLEPTSLIPRNEAMPEHCVICFFHDVMDHMLGAGLISEIACLKSEIGRHPVFLVKDTDPKVALLHPGVGAPLAAALLEETIALGGRKFIACGGAGTLDSHVLGKLIVPTSAIRDEGTSYHYLPPGEEVGPTPAALQAIEQTLNAAGVPFEKTKTWTTDAVYRETRGKVALRKESGCGCVEMEAAALFAVALFRGVELAQILYAGDDLGGDSWDSRNWDDQWAAREKLLQLGIKACGLI